MISLVVPVYQEADNIQGFLRDVEDAVREPHEILIVYDFPEDNTLPAIAALEPPCAAVRLVHNTLGRGVLNALKAGFQASGGEAIVVMMADRSDEPRDVAAMAKLVREGADVVAGSRYVRGGRQVGGPRLKRTLSCLAGLSLHYLAGLPIRDATNNFRAYSRRVIEQIPIEVEASFAVALELTLKAHWRGWRLAEVPTTWRDRTAGQSRFRLWGWLPHYLRWYVRALGRTWFGRRPRECATGTPKPSILGVDHVQITVPPDAVAQARTFYCGLLGLPEVEKPEALRDRGGFWVQVGDRQVHVGVESGVDRQASKAHVAYAVRGLADWRSLLSAAGVEVQEGVPIPGYDRIEFRDPFGHRVEFIEATRSGRV
jgi:catechol 2,3-dioxygenase-like lactoylglutathione lyase family enzyme